MLRRDLEEEAPSLNDIRSARAAREEFSKNADRLLEQAAEALVAQTLRPARLAMADDAWDPLQSAAREDMGRLSRDLKTVSDLLWDRAEAETAAKVRAANNWYKAKLATVRTASKVEMKHQAVELETQHRAQVEERERARFEAGSADNPDLAAAYHRVQELEREVAMLEPKAAQLAQAEKEYAKALDQAEHRVRRAEELADQLGREGATSSGEVLALRAEIAQSAAERAELVARAEEAELASVAWEARLMPGETARQALREALGVLVTEVERAVVHQSDAASADLVALARRTREEQLGGGGAVGTPGRAPLPTKSGEVAVASAAAEAAAQRDRLLTDLTRSRQAEVELESRLQETEAALLKMEAAAEERLADLKALKAATGGDGLAAVRLQEAARAAQEDAHAARLEANASADRLQAAQADAAAQTEGRARSEARVSEVEGALKEAQAKTAHLQALVEQAETAARDAAAGAARPWAQKVWALEEEVRACQQREGELQERHERLRAEASGKSHWETEAMRMEVEMAAVKRSLDQALNSVRTHVSEKRDLGEQVHPRVEPCTGVASPPLPSPLPPLPSSLSPLPSPISHLPSPSFPLLSSLPHLPSPLPCCVHGLPPRPFSPLRLDYSLVATAGAGARRPLRPGRSLAVPHECRARALDPGHGLCLL